MTQITSARLQGIASDLSTEVANLDRLAEDIAAVRIEIDRDQITPPSSMRISA